MERSSEVISVAFWRSIRSMSHKSGKPSSPVKSFGPTFDCDCPNPATILTATTLVTQIDPSARTTASARPYGEGLM